MESLDLTVPKNAEIFGRSVAAYNKVEGPRVGDFLKMPDGSFRRFTYDWGDSIQTTVPSIKDHYSASFYLSSCGSVDFSGSLDPSIDKKKLRHVVSWPPIKGIFWTFDCGVPGAGRGRSFKIDCRVFELIE